MAIATIAMAPATRTNGRPVDPRPDQPSSLAADVPQEAAANGTRSSRILAPYGRENPNVPAWQWVDLDHAVKHRVCDVIAVMLPAAPAFILVSNGPAAIHRRATSLRDRLWKNHLSQSRSLTNSALRRNVAKYLGFGTTVALKRREITLTADQLARVDRWLRGCTLAWLVCDSAADAIDLEAQLRKEFLPHLNQR